MEVAAQVAQIKRLDTRTTLSDTQPAGNETLDAAIDATLDNLCPGHLYLGADCASISGQFVFSMREFSKRNLHNQACAFNFSDYWSRICSVIVVTVIKLCFFIPPEVDIQRVKEIILSDRFRGIWTFLDLVEITINIPNQTDPFPTSLIASRRPLPTFTPIRTQTYPRPRLKHLRRRRPSAKARRQSNNWFYLLKNKRLLCSL